MVREFTELQGTMGGIYAREEGLPEDVWKAIYYHYLPVGVDADAAPSPRAAWARRPPVWAAVSLADKLDTIVGLFGAGEKPTGSRDPYGLRRAAHGVMRILIDLESADRAARRARPDLGALLQLAAAGLPAAQRPDEVARGRTSTSSSGSCWIGCVTSWRARGGDRRNVRAVTFGAVEALRPAAVAAQLEALSVFAASPQFTQLATAFKRVKNIAGELKGEAPLALGTLEGVLQEPAEQALLGGAASCACPWWTMRPDSRTTGRPWRICRSSVRRSTASSPMSWS